ncbi:MAG: Lin1244/Lin1753 domain-containing protein, partial [Candidatus Omnitrophota bacterium]
MKETYYFPHDYHARHDPKLERLRIEMGPVSDGIFWNLVEMLYEQGGYLQLKDVPIYSKMLNAD